MTSDRKDALRQFLFASDNCALVNLKLMRGDSQEVSELELSEQVHSALIQVKSGSAEGFSDFPEPATRGQVNIMELAKSL